MVSKYIDRDSSGIVEDYLEFIAVFLEPRSINKRTDRLQSRIKSADDLLKHQRQVDQYALLLNLLGSLLLNCEKIEKWYWESVLPLVSNLRNPKLRKCLDEIFDKLAKNRNFGELGIDPEVWGKVGALFSGKRSLLNNGFVLDHDKILDL